MTEAKQAEFLTAGVPVPAGDPYVEVAFWFGIQDIQRTPSTPAATALPASTARPSRRRQRSRRSPAACRRKPCGGIVDTAGPQFTVKAPQDGLVFRKEMGIDVKATDAGGVGIKGTELRIDGKFYRYFGDGHATMPILWESREWRNGTSHKLTFIAEDNAGNEASMSVTVRRRSAASRRPGPSRRSASRPWTRRPCG